MLCPQGLLLLLLLLLLVVVVVVHALRVCWRLGWILLLTPLGTLRALPRVRLQQLLPRLLLSLRLLLLLRHGCVNAVVTLGGGEIPASVRLSSCSRASTRLHVGHLFHATL